MKLKSQITFLLMMLTASISCFQHESKQEASQERPQKSTAQLQQEATEILRKQVGTWNCRWDMLDASGDVRTSFEGTETMTFAIEDRVLKVETEVPERNRKSISLKYFKPASGKFFFLSVDQNGDTWELHEEVGKDDSWSEPHINADKTTTYIRFTTLRKTENEIDVVMEMSSDQKDWRKIFNQYLVRQ